MYVRSFADGDGDGIGDLAGLRSRLDHIASLGVDAIWLCPISPSPQRDHGYDVADYFDVDPLFGDLTSPGRAVADAHHRGVRVLMDMVPNHCSDEHPWFRAAVASPPGSEERARFWFRDGRDGGPPNNWPAVFGGSVWAPVGGDDPQWYLGTFTPYQPDFDHRHPAVEAMFSDALRFWFDRGVDGFRVDAVWPVGKDPDLPDCPPLRPGEFNPYTRFRPEGHEVWRRWRRVVDAYMAEHPERDVMLVAEAYAPRRPDLIAEYTRPDEFHQCFAFDLLLSPWHAGSMRRAISEAFEHVRGQGAWPTFALNNHDTQRIVTRLGRQGITEAAAWTGSNLRYADGPVDIALGTVRARAAAGLLLAMPGAVYLYQGEELGLPEVLDLPDDAREDPVFARTGGALIGRDGCRVPLPWTAADRAAASWLPQPDWWNTYAVDAQDADDVLDAGAVPAADRGTSGALGVRRGRARRRPRRRRRAAPWRGRRRLQRQRAAGRRRRGGRTVADPVDRRPARRSRRPRRHHRLVHGRPVTSGRTMVLASVLSNLTDWLEDVSAEWWFLLVILVIAFFDSIIPIVPSETTVILGGVAAGAGEQYLLLVIAAGAAGAFLGDNCAYLIGRRFSPLDPTPRCQPGEDAAAPGVGRRADPQARRDAAHHRSLHPRRADDPDHHVRADPPAVGVVRRVGRHRRHHLGDVRGVPRRHLRLDVRPHRRLPPGVRVGAVGHGGHRDRPPPAGQARRASEPETAALP